MALLNQVICFLKKVILLGVLLFSLGGCSHVSYVMHVSWGQFSLYNHERPIEEVLKDPLTPSEVKSKLKWVAEIKQYIEKSLGLKATSNYTTYVDLKRPYVVWNLTAAKANALEVKEWTFPIVGAFPYLGFFDKEKALEWQKQEQDAGMDTYLRGVTAYSTLGYFRDPLLSSMLRTKSSMVNLLFHETTHTHFYIKGAGDFNEQAASFMGDYGEREWIVHEYGEDSKELLQWQNDRVDRRDFGKMLRDFADELKKVYQNAAEKNTDLMKQSRYDQFHRRVKGHDWKNPKMVQYASVIKNNAALLAFLTYEDSQSVFDLLYKKCGESVNHSLHYLIRFKEEIHNQHQSTLSFQQLLQQRLETLSKIGFCLDTQ